MHFENASAIGESSGALWLCTHLTAALKLIRRTFINKLMWQINDGLPEENMTEVLLQTNWPTYIDS